MKIYKKLILVFILLIMGIQSYAQSNLSVYRKTINVSGSAEMEIIPDELFFTVVLREYLDKDKKKVQIDKLEKDLQSAVNSANVPKENLQFENVYGERWREKKGKPEDFMQSKSYIIKLSEPSKIDVILEKLDAKGIDNTYLSNYSHSKIEQFRKELKIQAIKNAKEKAKYLLEAIGEQLGATLSVSENYSSPITWDLNPSYSFSNSSQTSLNNYDDPGRIGVSGISFKTIKLRFEIHAEFEIK